MVMAWGLTKAFLPIMASNLNPSGALIGLVTSSWFLTRVFMEIPSGLILAKVGRRNLFAIGLSMGVIAPIISFSATNIYMLIAGITLWGFGSGLFFLCSTVTLFDLFELDRRGKAMGTLQAIEQVGSFIGAPIGALIAGFWNFNSVFLVASMIVLTGSFVIFGSREIKDLDHNLQRTPEFKPLEDAVSCLKNWRLFGVSFMHLLETLVMQGIVFTVLQLYLSMQLKMSIEAIGLVLAGRTGSYIFATLSSGHLAGRTGRKPLIAVSFLTEAFCFCMFPMITGFEQAFLLTTLCGAAEGFVFTNLLVMMSELVPQTARVVAVGIYCTFIDIGGIAGPIIFALLYTIYNAWAAFLTASFVFLLSVAILVMIRSKT